MTLKERENNFKKVISRLHSCDKPNRFHDKFTAKTWKNFGKFEMPFCGMLEAVQFKTYQMYDYIKNESNLIEYDIDKQLKEMEEVLELGWKLIDDVAYNKSSRFEDEHRTIKLKFYDSRTDKIITNDNTSCIKHGDPIHIISHNPGPCTFDTKIEMAKSMAEEYIKTFYDNSKIPMDCVIYEAAFPFSNLEEVEEFKEKCKEDEDDRQRDIEKYFSLIAKYSSDWGD